MPAIPHIEERKRLLELRKQEEDLALEEEKALAPLKAEAKRQRDLLYLEPKVRQGVDGNDIEGGMRPREELSAKMAPFEAPIEEACKPFTVRREKLQQEIDAVEKITGCLREDEENGGYLTCGITGLPILESDEVWRVIAAAVPKASA